MKKIGLFLIIAIILSVLPTASFAAVAESSLIAQFSFDDIINGYVVDGKGNYHGLVYNDASIVSDSTRGKVLSLNGTNYVQLADGLLDSADDLTVSVWFYTENATSWVRVFDFGIDSSKYIMLTAPSGNTGTLVAEAKHSGGDLAIQSVAADNKEMALSKWTHVAVTVSGGKLTIYVDGEATESVDTEFIPSAIGKSVQNYIGKSQYADPNFTGLIDDLSVYGSALSAAQIKELMNESVKTPTGVLDSARANLAPPPSFPIANTTPSSNDKLVSRYNFDVNYNGKILDHINGNDGQLMGNAEIVNDSQRGSVLFLDGDSSYVRLPDNFFAGIDEITISTWYKFTGSSDYAWCRIFDLGNDSTEYIMTCPFSGSTQTVLFEMYDMANNPNKETYVDYNDPPIDTWAHIAVTVGGGMAELYVNGVLADSYDATIKPSDIPVTAQNYIGKSQYADPYFMGYIDDFAIYAKKMSAEEIVALSKADFSTPEIVDEINVVEDNTAAPAQSAPVTAPTAQARTSTSPQTSDDLTVAVIAVSVALLGFAIARKRKSEN